MLAFSANAASRRSNAARNRITWDVIRGKRTLYQAAAGFRMLTVTKHDLIHHPLPPGAYDSAGVCYQVIRWVQSQGRTAKDQAIPRLAEQMKADLRQALRRSTKL